MRPLINFGIHELEEQFEAKKHDLAFLSRLLSELKNRKTKRAIDLRNRTVNLLNVAVSRAQEVLYVVGNRDLWKKSGVFSELSDRI